MNQVSHILEKMRVTLLSQEFCHQFRMNSTDFIRNRILPFHAIFCFILNLPKKSIAVELLKFSSFLPKDAVSCAAITKARSKLSPKAFIGLNRVLVKEFYSAKVKTFSDFILAAIDGSFLELPISSLEIEQKYGTANNQYIKKPMALSSSVYDILNGITLDSILTHNRASERDLAFQHIENISNLSLQKPFLLLFDRGYPSLELIIFLMVKGVNFLMRSTTSFLKEVNEVRISGKRDIIIKFQARLSGEVWESMKSSFPHLNKKDYFSVRVIVVPLSNGENEILLTSLEDNIKYPYSIFKDLYFKRWKIEIEYKFKKSSIEIENFSGKTSIAVEQDFHATILAGNVHSLLVQEAEDEKDESIKSRKYPYKINKNVGFATLKYDLIEVLIDPGRCLISFCNKVKRSMKRNMVPIREGRNFPRTTKYRFNKYHMCLR